MLLLPVLWTIFCSLALTLSMERLSAYLRIIPKESYRRRANEDVPLLGGLAIVLSVISSFVIFPEVAYWPLIVSFLPLMAMGFVDDLKECPGLAKFLTQIAASVLMCYFIPAESNFFINLTANFWLGQFITVTFAIGLINAINLIDGLDGQAPFVSLICMGALAFLCPSSAAPLIIVAALAGFVPRNFSPAKIYLGEVGSSFLGFALASQAARLEVAQPVFENFAAILFLFSVPFSDTVAAMFRRVRKRVSFFSGDREHIHHRLIKLQFTTVEAWLVTSVMVATGALTCVLAHSLPRDLQWMLFAQAGLILSLMFGGIFMLERRVSQRLLGLSSQIIAKYLLPNLSTDIKPDPRRAMVFDMLPYFRELQGQGILFIQEFMKDLSASITAMPEVFDVRPVGSYSLMVLFYGNPQWSEEQIEQISRDLYTILHDHRIVRSMRRIPEGVSFLNEEHLGRVLPKRNSGSARSAA